LQYVLTGMFYFSGFCGHLNYSILGADLALVLLGTVLLTVLVCKKLVDCPGFVLALIVG